LFQDLLSPDEQAVVYARSQGWPAVSQLAIRSMSSASSREKSRIGLIAQHVKMTASLGEQLLQGVAPEIKQLLMDASVFESVSGPLLDAACARGDSAIRLASLTQFEALFEASDRSRQWVRLHPVFREFLHDRLVQGQASRARELHQRASAWFMQNGDLQAAVRHALLAGESAQAANLVDRAGSWQLILTHGSDFVAGLLRLFAPADLERFPSLLISQAYLSIRSGDWPAVRRCLTAADLQSPSFSPSEHRAYVVINALSEACLGERDKSGLLDQLDAFIETLATEDHVTRASAMAICALCSIDRAEFAAAERYSSDSIEEMRAGDCGVGIAYGMFHLATSLLYRGDWRSAERLILQACELARGHFGKDGMLEAVADGLLSRLLYERNQLQEARRLAWASLDALERQGAWFDIYVIVCETCVRTEAAESGYEAALIPLQRARRYARLRGMSRLETLVDAWECELLGDQDGPRLPTARLHIEIRDDSSSKLGDGAPSWRQRQAWAVVRIKHALTDGQYALASGLAATEYDLCVAEGRLAQAALLGALAALAAKGEGETRRAVRILSRSVDFAATAGAVRLFLDLGPTAKALIREALGDSKAFPASSSGRAFLLNVQREPRANSLDAQTDLSDRECDVLRELCRGRSNKVIARLLGLSDNTVKFHLKQIYRKLQVNSRTAAVFVAQRASQAVALEK